ncbi:hypothetical protein C7I36_03605 [Zobellella taiwanensis]|uniref:Uncharacterized protein n=1 Tax=Zobellella taiwanensis TaxID=347535 RepID=A0A2P7R9W5_9GAMM|nr:hypothetical protein [Zobellella taiwanensis]PSJ46995.1 hypothetical protein C7I36_03605 [Zobellella taiwanensis]
MELKDFVKKSIKDIMDGVYEAQSEVNSGKVASRFPGGALGWYESGLSNRQLIDFEVSVNVVDKEGSEAKLNVVAAVVGGVVKGDSSSSSSHTAKLQFKVPVEFPESS